MNKLISIISIISVAVIFSSCATTSEKAIQLVTQNQKSEAGKLCYTEKDSLRKECLSKIAILALKLQDTSNAEKWFHNAQFRQQDYIKVADTLFVSQKYQQAHFVYTRLPFQKFQRQYSILHKHFDSLTQELLKHDNLAVTELFVRTNYAGNEDYINATMGKAYLRKDDLATAQKYFAKSRYLGDKALTTYYWDKANYPKYIEYYRKNLPVDKAYEKVAAIYLRKSLFDSASIYIKKMPTYLQKEYYTQIAESFTLKDSPIAQAQYYAYAGNDQQVKKIGMELEKQGDLEGAVNVYSFGKGNSLKYAISKIADNMLKQNKLELALKYYQKSKLSSNYLGFTKVANAYFNNAQNQKSANVCSLMKDLNRAMCFHQISTKLFKAGKKDSVLVYEYQNYQDSTKAYGYLANLGYLQKDYSLAQKYYTLANNSDSLRGKHKLYSHLLNDTLYQDLIDLYKAQGKEWDGHMAVAIHQLLKMDKYGRQLKKDYLEANIKIAIIATKSKIMSTKAVMDLKAKRLLWSIDYAKAPLYQIQAILQKEIKTLPKESVLTILQEVALAYEEMEKNSQNLSTAIKWKYNSGIEKGLNSTKWNQAPKFYQTSRQKIQKLIKQLQNSLSS